jgi:hypothetical protein
MITSEYSEILRMLFRNMFKDGKKCDTWDLILSLHDEEDRQYFEMLARRHENGNAIPVHIR